MAADLNRSPWAPGPECPELDPGAVDVWLVRTRRPDSAVQAMIENLDPDERTRAARFRVPDAYKRYVVVRSALRRLLAAYIGTSPASIKVEAGPHGKPFLCAEPPTPSIQFNVSHSGDLGLIAVTPERHVGVDIEKHRERVDLEGIAKRFFAPEESSALMRAPEEERMHAFCQCWTRKEAYIKAWGEGLSHPLDTFVVSFGADVPPRIVLTRPDPQEADRWDLHDLPLAEPDYAAALVVERPVSVIRHWLYDVD